MRLQLRCRLVAKSSLILPRVACPHGAFLCENGAAMRASSLGHGCMCASVLPTDQVDIVARVLAGSPGDGRRCRGQPCVRAQKH